MSAHTRKHLINESNKVIHVIYHGINYLIPLSVAEKYQTTSKKSKHSEAVTIEEAFSDLIAKYGEQGTLLKGLRAREGLTQIEFSKVIHITQANLSAMERGKRPIGKELAMRIGNKFKIDYRLLL